MAPERIEGLMDSNPVYCQSADLWSVGVLAYILVCGRPPIMGETREELYHNISTGDFRFEGKEWENMLGIKQFISSLLKYDAMDRDEACLAANHEYLASILF